MKKTAGDHLDDLDQLIESLGKGGERGLSVQLRDQDIVLSGFAYDERSPVGIEQYSQAFDSTIEGFAQVAEAIRAWVLPSAKEQERYQEVLATRQREFQERSPEAVWGRILATTQAHHRCKGAKTCHEHAVDPLIPSCKKRRS